MMYSKLAGAFGFLPKAVWGGIAALILLGGTVWYCSKQVDDKVEQAKEIGAQTERAEGLARTVTNVEIANEAAKEINLPPADGPNCVKYNQCLQTNRGADKVCERFLRGGPASQCSN